MKLQKILLVLAATFSTASYAKCWKVWDCPKETELNGQGWPMLSGAGTPAVSDQGNFFVGVETTWQWQLKPAQFPLQDVWYRVPLASKIVLEDRATGHREYLASFEGGGISEIYYIEASKTAFLLRYDNDTNEDVYYRIVDGAKPEPLFNSYDPTGFSGDQPWSNIRTSLIPSPDSNSLAKVRCGEIWPEDSGSHDSVDTIPPRTARCYVSVLDAATLKTTLAEKSFELKEVRDLVVDDYFLVQPKFYWTQNNELLVTDNAASSYAFDRSGNQLPIAIPTVCEGPSTIGSQVTENGERVDVEDDTFILASGSDARYLPHTCQI